MKCFLYFSCIILVSSALECPSSDWFRYRNKCYLIEKTKFYTFQDNIDFCESQDAKTVSILSEEENSFIKSKLDPYWAYWIGIRQVDFDNKTYEWLDGSPYKYNNWDWRASRTNCSGATIYEGEWWEKTDCDNTNRAFCQIDMNDPLYKLRWQIMQVSQDLKKEIKAAEIRFNETTARLEKALITQNEMITNMNLNFQDELNNLKTQIKIGLNESTISI